MPELAGDPERVRQVGRADEQHVDAVDRGDLVGVTQAADGLDLDDPDDALVEALDVGVATAPRPAPRTRVATPRIPAGG